MPKRSEIRLTKRLVDAARTKRHDQVLFDRDLPGFGVRVRPSGAATYLVQFRDAHGRSRRISLGRHGPLTCEEARGLALATLGKAAKGENPADERSARLKAMTIAELGNLYFAEAEAGRVRGKRGLPKKASTLRIDRYRWLNYVAPLIGRRIAREIERKDVAQFLALAETRARKAGRSGAGERRLKGTLGGIMAYAVERGVIETNPCLGVKTRPDGRRRIALDEAQYRTLGRQLAVAEEAGEVWQAVEAARLIALTGCRRGEIACLRWAEVDLVGQALRFADSKTGSSVRPLGESACERLRRIAGYSASSPGGFVFPAVRGANGAYAGLPRAWRRIVRRRILTQSGEPLTLHGLRHAFAGVAAGELNYSEPTVAALIGHAGTSVTSRYIHSLDAALVAAADAVSGRVAQWLDEGAKLRAFEARETRTSSTCVTANYDPKADPDVEAFIKCDKMTNDLASDVQAMLARSLSEVVKRARAGLPMGRPRRGMKRRAWTLDVLTSDVKEAFAHQARRELKDAPLPAFVTRLLEAVAMKPRQKSLAHNARRARVIERRVSGT